MNWDSLLPTLEERVLKRCGNADEVFNERNLAHNLIGNRLFMAMPGILTGLGVLGTFVGLALGSEVVGATPIHQARLGIMFSKRVVHTTAARFSGRTGKAARQCSVSLKGRKWLEDELKHHHITRGDIIDRNAQRQRVS